MQLRIRSAIAILLLCSILFVGCSESNQSQGGATLPEPPLADILSAIEAAYGEDYPANGEIPPEVLELEFGLTSDLYVQAVGRMPMVSINNDRVVLAKAAPGKADALEEALQDARRKKIDDTLQYPANIAKTNAARVVRQGDYVAFLLIGAPADQALDPQSEEARQYAEAQVQIAVDAFHSVFEA